MDTKILPDFVKEISLSLILGVNNFEQDTMVSFLTNWHLVKPLLSTRIIVASFKTITNSCKLLSTSELSIVINDLMLSLLEPGGFEIAFLCRNAGMVFFLKNDSKGLLFFNSSISCFQIQVLVCLDQHWIKPFFENTTIKVPQSLNLTTVIGHKFGVIGNWVGAGVGLEIGDQTKTLWSRPSDTIYGDLEVAILITSKK
ncbi:hypothetical protein WICMUC_000313 [Wickerhamomyces mucosus]|uniref:Uncharacterized protein n=1 Tax=Wickerhamomyces mucosus TaxID=1378264 RepID=A0A9P8PXU9_9ASCO|nr:hypothetical protein WICMUC_000313 [Wickerhamomyces mucosus]